MEPVNLNDLYNKIVPAFTEEALAAFPEGERNNYRNLKIMPMALLVKADWNYKEEDEEMSVKLRNNLKRNGQIENIHVRWLETGFVEVVNGNHRYDQMAALGRETVLVYDHGKCTKEEAVRKCIETNETFFKTDEIKLAGLLKNLVDTTGMQDLIETLPYNEEELTNYSKLVDFEWNQYGRKTNDLTPTPAETKKLTIEYPTGQVGIVEEIGKLLHKFPGAKLV